jgi:hypothetical protein
MPINYDGRSLVPDISQALGIALGVAREKQAERKEEMRMARAEDDFETLVSGVGPLNSEASKKALSRLASISPEMAQFGLGILQMRDADKLKAERKELADASLLYQATLDTDDPVERSRFITQQIRERKEQGKDTSKLEQMLALDPAKQKLFARRQVIMAGDGQLLADESLKALREQVDLQNAILERDNRLRDQAQGKYGDVASMRDDYTKQSQKYVGVRDAFTSLDAALAQASPAGDIAGVFGFMKSIDPASSVREGEQATAKNAGGVPESMRSLYNEAIGKGGLTPKQRADFLRTARGQLDTAQKSQDKLASEFTRLAKLREFNPAEVIIDFSAPPTPAAPAAAANATAPKVTTKAAYDALPSGAIYIAPDGKKRRKR